MATDSGDHEQAQTRIPLTARIVHGGAWEVIKPKAT
jgi:hypothetical protein